MEYCSFSTHHSTTPLLRLSTLPTSPTPAVLLQGSGAVKTQPQPTYPHNRMIRSMFLRSTSLTAVIAAAAFAFSSTSPVIAQQKDVTIGLAVANLQADFFNQIKQSVEAEAKAKDVTVITVDAKGDSATQVSQVQDLITCGIKALIYIPAGATAGRAGADLGGRKAATDGPRL